MTVNIKERVTEPKSREYREITPADVGRSLFKAFGRQWPVSGFIGRIMPADVGKRVYRTGDRVVSVESAEQFQKRCEAQPVGRLQARRFEHRVEIELKCHETRACGGAPMQLAGNLSLREAGADATRLAFECKKCFRRVMVTDAWSPSTEAIDAAHDAEP